MTYGGRMTNRRGSSVPKSSNFTPRKKERETAKKKQSEDVLRAYKQQQMERLFSDGDEPTDLLQAAQSEIRQLKKELMEVREQNAALQAALCSKVFQKELDQEQGSIRPTGTCSTPRSGSLALLDAGSRVPFAPEVSGSRVRAASEVQCPAPSLWRSAPRVTPQVAPSVPLDIEELPLPARVPSPDNLFQAVEDQPGALEQQTLFQTEGDKVHVGGNIWILSKSYDDMLRRPKDSLFVREAAVSIFSTAGLAGKSVTGTISNRTKGSPKPALDKTKFEILSKTQKEADDERRLKRIPIPKPPSDESDSGSSEDSRMGACQPRKKERETAKKKQSEDVLRAYKQQQMERLFSDGDEPTDLLQAAQSEIRQLKKELMEVREQNAALQAALCSKVFQKELDQEQGSIRPTGTCSTPRSGSLALLDAGSRVPFAPEVSGSRVRAASEVQCPAPSLWRSAPRVTPQVAPSVPLDIEELPLPARVPSPDNLFQAVEDQPGALEQQTLFQTEGDKVHVGGNIWILSKSYDDMLRRPKDSLFVREAAVSIFSTAGLAGKSVTGTISNRTKGSPKPALDKTKFEILSKFFLHYLVLRCKCNPKCNCDLFVECGCKNKCTCGIPKRLTLLNKHVAAKITDIHRQAKRLREESARCKKPQLRAHLSGGWKARSLQARGTKRCRGGLGIRGMRPCAQEPHGARPESCRPSGFCPRVRDGRSPSALRQHCRPSRSTLVHS
ncbi:hypothetical protein ISCGN_031935 [Ixodes scapularis]